MRIGVWGYGSFLVVFEIVCIRLFLICVIFVFSLFLVVIWLVVCV